MQLPDACLWFLPLSILVIGVRAQTCYCQWLHRVGHITPENRSGCWLSARITAEGLLKLGGD